MKGYPIAFNIYAEDANEAAGARKAIVDFIDSHAREGRAVTGEKIIKALRSLDDNPFVRAKIIDYLK